MLRIVAGRHKGRRLTAPSGGDTRPTSDRAREALFSILGARGLPDAETRVLDAFAGTGALGLEALSRGAAHATFFERDAKAIVALGANIGTLQETDRTAVLRVDALKPPRADSPAGLVFLDPPYGSGVNGPCLDALERQGWLAQDCLVVVEVAAAEPFVPPDGFGMLDERRYGAAKIILLERAA